MNRQRITPLSEGGVLELAEAADGKRYEIHLITHAFEILEQFDAENFELGVTDLSKRTHLTKTKVFRLLSTLKDLDYIDQNPRTGTYRLGFKAMKLGQAVGRQAWCLKQARGIMEAMARESRETVSFSVLREFETFVLDVVEGKEYLRVIPTVGQPLSSYCCAAGKVLLAHLGEEKLRRYLSANTFEPLTPFTMTRAKEIAVHLEMVVEQGYALEEREMDPEVVGLAAPIRDYESRVVGAVSISAPATRCRPQQLRDHLIPLLLKGVVQISAKLGYAPRTALPADPENEPETAELFPAPV